MKKQSIVLTERPNKAKERGREVRNDNREKTTNEQGTCC